MLRISELAERSGVPSSTLRYYERIGLVEPLGRADNGYRVYDEATLEQLAFIGRAKRLGMTLDEVATLVDPWFAGDCEPLQDRLRAFVAGRIAELRRQITEDSAFERQLERISVRLSHGRAIPERCGPDCGCDTDLLDAAEPSAGASMVCSLAEGEARRRLQEWRRVLGMAQRAERRVGGLRVVFDPSAGLIAELAALCAAETTCCPFFIFALEITVSAVVLSIGGPADAEDAMSVFFDLVQPPAPRPVVAAAGKNAGLASTEPVGHFPSGGPVPRRPEQKESAGSVEMSAR
ncbi:MAG TPA: MerR family transcriptional regulator [Acidimicrobiales bacterium]|nr:MerR family transcriptional regulator [Acidimicrobiales bacterium]